MKIVQHHANWKLQNPTNDRGRQCERDGVNTETHEHLAGGANDLHVENSGRALKRPLANPIVQHFVKDDPSAVESVGLPITGVVDLECQGVLFGILDYPEDARVMEMDIRKVHAVAIPANA